MSFGKKTLIISGERDRFAERQPRRSYHCAETDASEGAIGCLQR